MCMLCKFLNYAVGRAFVCLLFLSLPAHAQVVPAELDLGGVRLAIPALIRPLIQVKMNELKGNQATYLQKLAQADLYLPVIAEILQENGVPEVFKYLAFFDQNPQDDKVFWQLPEALVERLGLQKNKNIDETSNTISVAQAVAKQLKNNQGSLNNWLLTLLSYRQGAENAQGYFTNKLPQLNLQNLILNKKLDLSNALHPDILEFVAHWTMFKDVLGRNPSAPTTLVRYKQTSNKTLKQIAEEFQIKPTEIAQYNDWLTDDTAIPTDKDYEVLLPVSTGSPSTEVEIQTSRGGEIDFNTYEDNAFETTEAVETVTQKTHTVVKGETLFSISRKYGVPVANLKQWNLMNASATISIGQQLKVAETQTKTSLPTTKTTQTTQTTQIHTVQAGEGLFKVARLYGVSAGEIRTWNNLTSDNLNVGQKITIKKTKVGSEPKTNTPTPTPPKETTQTKLAYSLRVLSSKTVPIQMTALGLRLTFTTEARQKVQKYVDKLVESPPAYFRQMETIDTYMPLIERELQQAGLPLDFRFLPIQESALKATAVSKSNAVGYWQFKKESAVEEGVIVNEAIDERMNIVASTIGAINYLKKSQLMFGNWVNALLSYNMGRTGAKNQIAKTYTQNLQGVESMQITGDTHWYVMKFLAHLVAFDDEVGVSKPTQILTDYTQGSKKTLAQIAQEQKTTLQILQPHNQWLKRGIVPVGKTFSVIIPEK